MKISDIIKKSEKAHEEYLKTKKILNEEDQIKKLLDIKKYIQEKTKKEEEKETKE